MTQEQQDRLYRKMAPEAYRFADTYLNEPLEVPELEVLIDEIVTPRLGDRLLAIGAPDKEYWFLVCVDTWLGFYKLLTAYDLEQLRKDVFLPDHFGIGEVMYSEEQGTMMPSLRGLFWEALKSVVDQLTREYSSKAKGSMKDHEYRKAITMFYRKAECLCLTGGILPVPVFVEMLQGDPQDFTAYNRQHVTIRQYV